MPAVCASNPFTSSDEFLSFICKLRFTMLDVRRLRLLRELAERRTVTAVAHALSYTPSAVSQQLAALERDAGVPLLERVGRGVQLTEAGHRLVAHADVVLARLEAAEADLEIVSGRVGGPAADRHLPDRRPRAGAARPCGRSRSATPSCAARSSRPRPRTRCRRCGSATSTSCWPRSTTTRRASATRRSSTATCAATSWCSRSPTGHPAAAQTSIAFADLAGDEWAGGELDTAWHDMLVRACRSIGGFEPDVRHFVDDVQLILGLVAATGAVALVPADGLVGGDGGRQRAPACDGLDLNRRIFTAVRPARATGRRSAPCVRRWRSGQQHSGWRPQR